MLRITLLCITCLLFACGGDPKTDAPPVTERADAVPDLLAAPLLEGSSTRKLGMVNKPSVSIERGYQLVTGSGHYTSFSLGHAHEQPIMVTFEGAEPVHVTVSPGSWVPVSLRTFANEIRFHWEGGPLWLSQPHLWDRDMDKVPNLLLISVDTLRRDHFSPEHMPQTYALFREHGAIFKRAYTTTTWTLPAHTSLLSSAYPTSHGVRQPDQKLSDKVYTLAEHLRGIGYYTAAFTEGNYVSASYGFDQGFLHYHEDPPVILDGKPGQESKLESTIAALRSHVESKRDLPGFYFMHTYEVHCPYLPHGDLSDAEGLGSTRWLLDHDGKTSASENEKLEQLYAGEVRYVDGQLTLLLKDLLARGNWLVALVSDHGEEFGEHGGLLHADTVYEEAAAVPFAVAGVGVRPMDTDNLVSLVDVAPTLVGLLKLPAAEGWQGRDLSQNQLPRAVFAESFFFGVHLPVEDPMVAGVWAEEHKLIHFRNQGEDQVSLFHLGNDPSEKVNLLDDSVRVRNRLFGLLKSYLKEQGLSAQKVDDLTPEQIEVMRSLGYLK